MTVFVTQALGYGGNLLYWNNILDSIYEERKDFQVFYPGKDRTLASGLRLEKKVYVLSLKFSLRTSLYHYNVNLISPSFIIDLIRIRPKRIIISEFSIIALYVKLYSFIFNVKIIGLVENDPKYIQKRHSSIRVAYRRLMAKSMDFIIVNNNEGRRYLEQDLLMDTTKVKTIPYLTSAFGYRDKPKVLSKNELLTFLFVGQIRNRKGIYQLIDSLNRLVHQYKLRNFKVLVVGEGPDLERVQEIALSYGIEDHIEFLGAIPYEDLYFVFNQAHVFLNLTLGDYRALVGFEAISCGLPLIYSNYDGACNEVVKNAINGFTVDPLNVGMIADAMAFFLNNRHMVLQHSLESLKLAEKYSFENISKNWLNIMAL